MIFPVPEILNLFAAVLLVFSFGIFLFSCRLWIEHHNHLSSAECRVLIAFSDLIHVLGDEFKLPRTDFWMSQFPLFEPANEAHLIPFSEELDCLANEHHEIVLSRVGT